MPERAYTSTDHVLIQFDQALRTLVGRPSTTGRPMPGATVDEPELDPAEQRRAARLMRVNHTGEVCAQALYHGQAMTARTPRVQEAMQAAAAEESDHLVWCEQRIRALGGHTSVLNPLFYTGSLTLGALTGRAGDPWSLGFVTETERQVESHLEDHLRKLPERDHKSRAVLAVMRDDEIRHGEAARQAGGRDLPLPIRLAMKAVSKLMTRSTYWI